MPQLDINTFPAQICWLLLTFFLLFFLMSYFIVPRLQRIFDSRWERQDSLFRRAQELQAEANDFLIRGELLIKKSREEGEEIIADIKKRQHDEKEVILLKLEKELSKDILETEKQIRLKKDLIINDMQKTVEDLMDTYLEKYNKKIRTQSISKPG